MTDWVTCLSYGQTLACPAGVVSLFPLVTPPDLAEYDPSSFMGGNTAQYPRNRKVLRAVGQIWLDGANYPGDGGFVRWGWRLLALPWDFQGNGFDTPWSPADQVMNDPLYTDVVRWWGERWYQEPDVLPNIEGVGLDTFSHPWWTQVDVSPSGSYGMQRGEWPCLLVDNTFQDVEISVVHRLRFVVG